MEDKDKKPGMQSDRLAWIYTVAYQKEVMTIQSFLLRAVAIK